MKKIPLLLIVLFVMASCPSFSNYGYIERAEIIDQRTIHIYFSGQTSELDPTYDIEILVNGVQPYYIRSYEYNIFQDLINGLTRYRCTLNKNLLPRDKVEITGSGRSVFGTVILNFEEETDV
jgi:hypothetical protein